MEEMSDILEFLKETSREKAYNIGFKILNDFREDAMAADVPAEAKLKTLSEMIEFFTGKEEYEKCAFLHELKMEIIDKTNGQSSSSI